MAIGERIHHFRLLHGFTQKYLGQQLSFSDMQADVRIALYEKGARILIFIYLYMYHNTLT